MAKSDPNLLDKARVQVMSKQKALVELRKTYLSGNSKLAIPLLEKTGYETLANDLRPATWDGADAQKMKNVSKVVRHVLKKAPPDRLPAGLDPERVTAEFDRAVLGLLPEKKLKSRK